VRRWYRELILGGRQHSRVAKTDPARCFTSAAADGRSRGGPDRELSCDACEINPMTRASSSCSEKKRCEPVIGFSVLVSEDNDSTPDERELKVPMLSNMQASQIEQIREWQFAATHAKPCGALPAYQLHR
jgi:hypothetical protein